MATVPAEVQGPSDEELIQAVRDGSTDAYADLYQRHVNAAYNMARQVSKSPAEADDLVSESFAKVLDTLRGGRGPTVAFRAYLLTSLRHTAYDRTRRERKVQLSEDVTELSGVDVSVPFTDTAVAGLERSLAAQAFEQLPERWRTVLWHVEVEGEPPAKVAPLLGLTPNGVSALAYRAREGLRQAYLQVHLNQLEESGAGVAQCRAAVNRLGSWTRGGLSKRETAQVENHLDGCDRCRTLATELVEVNGSLRVIIAPLLLGTSALGYLSFHGGSTAAAGTAAGSASGAVGAASSVPRQVTTSAATAAALVAGIALALTSGVQPLKPTAAPAPPPPPAAPAAPPPPVPAAPQPKPAPTPPAPSPAPPPPATPSMNASGPEKPLALVAGGAPEALPITVTNSGTGTSPPVTTTLSLPPGISGVIQGASQPATTGPASTSPQSASARSSDVAAAGAPSVNCDNTTGTIRCATSRGLNAGESFTFDFQLQADKTAPGGEITASVTAGDKIDLRLAAVPVQVRPAEVDGVSVEASSWSGVPWINSRVRLDVRNTGTTSGRAEAVAWLPEGVRAIGLPSECKILPAHRQEVRCSAELRPGESFRGRLWMTSSAELISTHHDLDGSPSERQLFDFVTVPVTATLRTAKADDSVDVRLWGPWIPTPPPDVDPPEIDPPTSTAPSEPDCAHPWIPVPEDWWTPERPCWLPSDSHRPPWWSTPSSTTAPTTESPATDSSESEPPTTDQVPSTTQPPTTTQPTTTQPPALFSPSESSPSSSPQEGPTSTSTPEPLGSGQDR